MVWEPFALAVLFGLLISAGIYFVVMWPQVAPDDDEPAGDAALADAALAVPPPADADAPAADATPPAAADAAPAIDAPAPASS
ncbi:MAG: hypothetical protein R3B06_28850 [Kofleriaceae bacterium]